MKKIILACILMLGTVLSCSPRLPAYRNLVDKPFAPEASVGVWCFDTDSGLKVYRNASTENPTPCPDFSKINRVTKRFCWEHATPTLHAKPTECLRGYRIIVSNRLNECNQLNLDITPARCITPVGAAVTWTRKSLVAGPEPHSGLGWRFHLWHTACHYLNPNDYKHSAECYNPPLATDSIPDDDEIPWLY